jgi:hypothetical protein
VKSRAILVSLVVFLLLAGVAWAQVSPAHDLRWHVLSGGGSPMSSPVHSINGTLGQLAIGPAGGTEHSVGAGYWHSLPNVGFRIFMPLVVRSS